MNMNEQSESAQKKTRQLFGRKSEQYDKSSLLVNQDNLSSIIEMSGITAGKRVLDVATGTGYMAIAAADTGAEVIATDFTPAMLNKTAEALSHKANADMALTDADRLAFYSDAFDVVTCRVSIHHFANPQIAIGEMARVCKPGGRVVIMDVVSSEDKAKSKLHNQMGKMRDFSEVRQWPCSELEGMIESSGLNTIQIESWKHQMAFDEWIRLGGADEDTSKVIREMMIDSIEGDKADMNPQIVDGELFFTWTTAILIAVK